MENIKSFLGFTDSIKEPLKTRVEDILSKLIRDEDGKVYNRRTFLVVKMLDGRVPVTESGVVTYNRRTGEPNKEKTEYRLQASNGYFYELNKTEFDFCVYCMSRGFNSLGAIQKYEALEEDRIRFKKIAEEEQARLVKEEAQRKREEAERVHELILKEMETIPSVEKKLMADIFLSILGQEPPFRSLELIPLIHHIDNDICRQQVKERLHNDNKASIKTFECLTGIKLPKGYKDRMSFLDTVSAKDFRGMVEYKARKAPEKREVAEEEFYTSLTRSDGSMVWIKTLAEGFTLHGIDFYIEKRSNAYTINVAEIGIRIAAGKNRQEAMNDLRNAFKNKGKEAITQRISECKILIENKAGVNPRYKKQEESNV